MLGNPNCWEALSVKDMTPSDKMKVTGGVWWEWLSFEIRLHKGSREFFLVESHKARMHWVASMSVGGRPSGMASKWKSERPLRASGPLDLRRRRWLNSEFTRLCGSLCYGGALLVSEMDLCDLVMEMGSEEHVASCFLLLNPSFRLFSFLERVLLYNNETVVVSYD